MQLMHQPTQNQAIPTPFSLPFGSFNNQVAPPVSQPVATPSQLSAQHQSRASNADDSNAEVSGIPRASRSGQLDSGRGRGASQAGSSRSQRDISPESAGEEGDGYAMNRKRKEAQPKSIPVKNFSGEDKEQDFDLWVLQFEAAVDRGINPHSKKRHHEYCLQWISTCLSPYSFAIWMRAEHKLSDWEELKKELAMAYEDPSIRSEWRTNMKALMWDEHNQTLQAYCAKVMRCVDTFDKEIATTVAAKRSNYYLRFVNGLPNDYNEQVRVSCTKENIDKALGICIRFQGVKKSRHQDKIKSGKPEIAAAATYEDTNTPSRVTYNETDIQRLNNRVRKLEENNTVPTQTPHDGRQSRFSTHQSGGSYSGGRRNYNAGHSPYPKDQSASKDGHNPDKSGDRMKRWVSYNQNFRGRYHRGQSSRGRNFQHRYRNPQQQTEAAASAADEGLALQPEEEEEEEAGDNLDDTCVAYGAFCEMEAEAKFLKFCETKDQMQSENS